jgi:hypothetical protein
MGTMVTSSQGDEPPGRNGVGEDTAATCICGVTVGGAEVDAGAGTQAARMHKADRTRLTNQRARGILLTILPKGN